MALIDIKYPMLVGTHYRPPSSNDQFAFELMKAFDHIATRKTLPQAARRKNLKNKNPEITTRLKENEMFLEAYNTCRSLQLSLPTRI